MYPLPRAGRGVLGLTQLRGHPVVVLVPTGQATRIAGSVARVDLPIDRVEPDRALEHDDARAIEQGPCDS